MVPPCESTATEPKPCSCVVNMPWPVTAPRTADPALLAEEDHGGLQVRVVRHEPVGLHRQRSRPVELHDRDVHAAEAVVDAAAAPGDHHRHLLAADHPTSHAADPARPG